MSFFSIIPTLLLVALLVVKAASEYEEDDSHADYGPAVYKYAYEVDDEKYGDFKKHQEESDGDLVKGEYSVLEPDGNLRTVQYTVDKHSGFNAVVTNVKDEYYQPPEHVPHKKEEEYKPHYKENIIEYNKPKLNIHYEKKKEFKPLKYVNHVEQPHHYSNIQQHHKKEEYRPQFDSNKKENNYQNYVQFKKEIEKRPLKTQNNYEQYNQETQQSVQYDQPQYKPQTINKGNYKQQLTKKEEKRPVVQYEVVDKEQDIPVVRYQPNKELYHHPTSNKQESFVNTDENQKEPLKEEQYKPQNYNVADIIQQMIKIHQNRQLVKNKQEEYKSDENQQPQNKANVLEYIQHMVQRNQKQLQQQQQQERPNQQLNNAYYQQEEERQLAPQQKAYQPKKHQEPKENVEKHYYKLPIKKQEHNPKEYYQAPIKKEVHTVKQYQPKKEIKYKPVKEEFHRTEHNDSNQATYKKYKYVSSPQSHKQDVSKTSRYAKH